jgi:hypothetical protein
MLRQHLTVPIDPPDRVINRADIDLYQGSGLQLTLDVVNDDGDPVNLSGIESVRSHIRRYPGAPELAAEFTVNLDDLATGRVTLTLDPAQTRPLVGVYAYDVKWLDPTPVPMDPNGITGFFVGGAVTVDAEVTTHT